MIFHLLTLTALLAPLAHGQDRLQAEAEPERTMLIQTRSDGTSSPESVEELAYIPVDSPQALRGSAVRRCLSLSPARPHIAVVLQTPEGEPYPGGTVPRVYNVNRGQFRGVSMPLADEREEVVLRAEPDLELGEVTMAVVPKAKTQASFRYTSDSVVLELISLESGVTLLTSEDWNSDESLAFQAPPGRYQLVARGQAFVDGWHGELFEERTLGRATEMVEIRAAATTHVELELDAGARIELRINGGRSALDVAAARQRFPDLDDENLRNLLVDHVSVTLRCDGRRPESVLWKRAGAIQCSLSSKWPIGESKLSQVVPTGTFELRVETLAGRTVSRQVELKAGETLQVEVTLPSELPSAGGDTDPR